MFHSIRDLGYAVIARGGDSLGPHGVIEVIQANRSIIARYEAPKHHTTELRDYFGLSSSLCNGRAEIVDGEPFRY